MTIESIKDAAEAAGSLYGPTVDELQSQAIQHMYQWNPKLHKSLMKSGRLREVTQKAAEQAQSEINDLMQAGLQRHEAEEYVLPEYILTPPDPDAVARFEDQ